jgi:hypothetical protein
LIVIRKENIGEKTTKELNRRNKVFGASLKQYPVFRPTFSILMDIK